MHSVSVLLDSSLQCRIQTIRGVFLVCFLTQLLLFIDAKLINKPCFGVGKLNKHILGKKKNSGLPSEVCFFAEKYSCI